ncbi:MAG: TatD family hydrolase, partial [Acutalibacteraceae bacterium]
MYNNIFDTHAHYDDEKFDGDRAEVLSLVKNNGVCKIIDCGCDLKSSLAAVKLSKDYDFIYAAVGVHPHEAEEACEDDFLQIQKLYSNPKIVAVGEIGLDYHYDFSPRDKQIEVFERQLILANELNLPVIVHDREAHEDMMNLLKKHRPKGVVHCFSGSAESAREIVSLGMYIGLGGAVTFKNARKPLEVAAYVPDDRLLLETDCPYMAPVPFRGKRCDSSMIPYSA